MRKGFTLIEVLVVVAIIGILATVIVLSIGPKSDSVVSVVEAEYPAPTNYAVDAAGVLSAEQLASLNEKLKGLDGDKHQFGVALVKSTKPMEISDYAVKLAEKWKAGDADKDNGAIIVIATQDRKVWITVGYGLEGDITDADAGRVLDNDMLPHLKGGDWYGALVAGLDGLVAQVK